MKWVALFLVVFCMTSCVKVGLNEETKPVVESAVVEIKRLNDNLEAYQKDLQELLQFLRKMSGSKSVVAPAPQPPGLILPEKDEKKK